MTICYVCNKEISNENRCFEHIFLNSIGGRLKSDSLICKKCNSNFGNLIDSELSKQLNHIANMLDIQRDRGKPQPIVGTDKITGERWEIQSGGKPTMSKPVVIEEENEKGQKHITVRARSMKEARNIMKGYSKKYPEININELLKNTKNRREYLDNKIKFGVKIGGEEAFRSICKTAINYYMLAGGHRDFIIDLLSYIMDGDKKDVVWFYYPEKEIIQKDVDEIVHSIVLIGNPDEKMLYANIEFFSVFKFIVLLNDNYDEKALERNYVFDVMNRTEVSKRIKFKPKREEIIEILQTKPSPEEKINKCYSNMLPFIIGKQRESHVNNMITRALENSFSKYPEGIIITQEMIDEFVDEFMKEITPWIIHNYEDKE